MRYEKKAFLSRKDLKEFVVGKEIEEIGDWAFAYCNQLREVALENPQVKLGRDVFLDCHQLQKISLPNKSEAVAVLLAMVATKKEGAYLLDLAEAGTEEWFHKWDSHLDRFVNTPDEEGYQKQVLCGEEDYGSTDFGNYISNRRKEKIRLLYKRLLYSEALAESMRDKWTQYILEHTKKPDFPGIREEAWELILQEYGDQRPYYELFLKLGAVSQDNLSLILQDIGEQYPEMKAYYIQQLMGSQEEEQRTEQFFADLLF